MNFDIREWLEFDDKGRAVCPSCQSAKGESHNKRNLSVLESGAYKCHRGCSTEEIRAALGAEKPKQIPTAMAPKTKATVSPQKINEAHERLLAESTHALQWLKQRGMDESIIQRHKLGVGRAKVGEKFEPCILIPIPANSDGTAFYQKKRIAPWIDNHPNPDYKPWSQFGIPAMVWFTHKPEKALSTWLCEGEWDAMLLAERVRLEKLPIAVATFTCGCQTVPPDQELEKLPGLVHIFYDRNDAPNQRGERPGETGAAKVAKAIGDRARICQVPMPSDCTVKGWDITDAILKGYGLPEFQQAANEGKPYQGGSTENPLRDRLISTDQLIATAPEFVEWLVPDLLTADELFALGSPPRGGKSLMCMLLSKCIATGENFLDRPVTKGSVIYVNLEDSPAKVRERIESQEWASGLPIYWLDKFKLNETGQLIELADGMEDLRLIILDTLSRIRTDETSESAAEMSMVLEPLQEFAKSRKVCILLVHHTRKLHSDNTTLDELFDSLRGSSAIRGTARGLWIIAPADNNSYRLGVENGWGKHDLKIRLNAERLEWQLIGKWQPLINLDQKQICLDFLNKVGSATIEVIANETGIPKRSLYTVLDRLCHDKLIEKTGNRKSAVYQRPIQLIQQLNTLLNSANAEPVSDTGAIQQKKQIFSTTQQPESDHDCNCNDDHFSASTQKPNFVELGGKQASNVDTASDSAIQQNANSNSTVELQEGDTVEIRKGRFAGKRCQVMGFSDSGEVCVKADTWYVEQQYWAADLKLLNSRQKRMEARDRLMAQGASLTEAFQQVPDEA